VLQLWREYLPAGPKRAPITPGAGQIAKQRVLAFSDDNGVGVPGKKVSITGALNFVLKLPPDNRWIGPAVGLCTDCADAVAKIYHNHRVLEKTCKIGGQLSMIFDEMKEIMKLGLAKQKEIVPNRKSAQ